MEKRNKNYTLIPNQLIRSQGLTAHEKVVYMVLKSLNPCHPSHKLITQWTGLGMTSVNTALQGLKRKNLVNWKKGNSNRRANYYFLTMSENWRLPRQTVPNKTKSEGSEDPLYYDPIFDMTDEQIAKMDHERPVADAEEEDEYIRRCIEEMDQLEDDQLYRQTVPNKTKSDEHITLDVKEENKPKSAVLVGRKPYRKKVRWSKRPK